MALYLYTVTIVFEDRTFAIDQVSAQTPEQALHQAFTQAEALKNHDRAALEEMSKKHTSMHQVANIRGVWNWHQIPNDSSTTSDIFGGIIVQTDSNAPVRQHGT